MGIPSPSTVQTSHSKREARLNTQVVRVIDESATGGGPPPEIGPPWRKQSRWHLIAMKEWEKEEHQTVLECRAAVAILRRMSRAPRHWRRRVLIITDSLVTLGCLAKGRSSSRSLLHLCRQAGVVQLVTGLRPVFRWVSSPNNVADGPSRGGPLGVDKDTAGKALRKVRGIPKKVMARLARLRPHHPTSRKKGVVHL